MLSNDSYENERSVNENLSDMEGKDKDQFYCPMKCEGDKVYDESGNCPVCNMDLVSVDDEEADHKQHHSSEHAHEHAHEAYSGGPAKYFCPMHCEGDKTYDEPGDCPVCGMHLKKEETKSVPGNKQTIYTCPMHPEVKQDHPAAAQNAEWISFLKKRMQAARKIIPTK